MSYSHRWDYGYQITAMANRTILVDNNTWNNTHISRVGQAMASPEDKAYEIMRELDVDYVLVIFGGLTGAWHSGTGTRGKGRGGYLMWVGASSLAEINYGD